MRSRPIIVLALLTLLFLGGCAVESAPKGPVVIQIDITDKGVTPSGASKKVALDSEVTLRISAAHDDIVHVHGYNKEFKVSKGRSTQVKFKADKPGRFEIETHNPALTIIALDVS